MNIQNLWFEEKREKYHQFLSEIINFHKHKNRNMWRANKFRLVKPDPSNCCRNKISGLLIELQRRLCKDAQYDLGLH